MECHGLPGDSITGLTHWVPCVSPAGWCNGNIGDSCSPAPGSTPGPAILSSGEK